MILEGFMTRNYQFTIQLRHPIQDINALEKNLYEAQCDDALIYIKDSVVYLEFDRKSPNKQSAIESAIQDVQNAGYSSITVY